MQYLLLTTPAAPHPHYLCSTHSAIHKAPDSVTPCTPHPVTHAAPRPCYPPMLQLIPATHPAPRSSGTSSLLTTHAAPRPSAPLAPGPSCGSARTLSQQPKTSESLPHIVGRTSTAARTTESGAAVVVACWVRHVAPRCLALSLQKQCRKHGLTPGSRELEW